MSAINFLKHWQSSRSGLFGLGLAGLALISSGLLIWYYTFCQTHLPPNVWINNVGVGGLTYAQAENRLQNDGSTPTQHSLLVVVDDISIASTSAELGVFYDYSTPLNELKVKTNSGSLRRRVAEILSYLITNKNLSAPLEYDQNKLTNMLTELNKNIAYPGATPSAALATSGRADTLSVDPGKSGREINQTATQSRALTALRSGENTIEAVVASTSSVLNQEQIAQVEERVANLVGKQLAFSFENSSFYLTDQMMVGLLSLPTGVDLEKLENLVNSWSDKLNRSPQEPELVYEPSTLEVSKFTPPKDGRALNTTKTQEQILATIANLETPEVKNLGADAPDVTAEPIQLEVVTTPPNTSLAETNDLGINELIGFGDSQYDHSIPNRIHNVKITTDRISHTIVPPGAEFRFNDTLGPVSSKTGYRSAYVIRNGQTELGDGGGVCQVSTTLFRSVLDAGLDVTLRLPHSYRVSYYELDHKPGIDATVYAGNVDFRFINDTDHHILIYGEANSDDLYMYFNLYGTSDGRTSEIIDHKTWNYRPPLAPVYIDDPSLPPGKLKQVDWEAAGISASFTNVVKDKNGEVIYEDTYVSNYRPWAAKYLRGVEQ